MSALEVIEFADLAEPYGVPYNSVIGGRVTLYGFAVEETTGTAPARLVLYDGADTTSNTFYPIRLAPGESTSDQLGVKGVRFRIGLLPVVTTGSVAGMLYVAVRGL